MPSKQFRMPRFAGFENETALLRFIDGWTDKTSEYRKQCEAFLQQLDAKTAECRKAIAEAQLAEDVATAQARAKEWERIAEERCRQREDDLVKKEAEFEESMAKTRAEMTRRAEDHTRVTNERSRALLQRTNEVAAREKAIAAREAEAAAKWQDAAKMLEQAQESKATYDSKIAKMREIAG